MRCGNDLLAAFAAFLSSSNILVIRDLLRFNLPEFCSFRILTRAPVFEKIFTSIHTLDYSLCSGPNPLRAATGYLTMGQYIIK